MTAVARQPVEAWILDQLTECPMPVMHLARRLQSRDRVDLDAALRAVTMCLGRLRGDGTVEVFRTPQRVKIGRGSWKAGTVMYRLTVPPVSQEPNP